MKTLIVGYILLVLAAVVGWVMNIVAVVHAAGGPLTAKLIIRIVGIFAAPLGAIMGYIS